MTDEENTSNQDGSGRVGWIYKLRKEEFITELGNRGKPTEGNVEELRTKLVNEIRSAKKKNIEPLPVGQTVNTDMTKEDIYGQMDAIRKWGLHYDGSRDPIEFLERIEELQTAYEIQDNVMLRALPETMKGKAILWYRNHKKYWDNWKDFVRDFTNFFSTTHNTELLEAQIRNRMQRENEETKEYIIDIQTLIRRQQFRLSRGAR